ncbi:MAG TPA: hypothetical protein PLW23_07140, partial [Bacteroidales bacterium]|nr:hypothetical protein [Bacteroidales bacterium]
MKAIFYILIIALVGMSSCTLNLYTTSGGYDDVYMTGSEPKQVAVDKQIVDEHKANYEETYNAEFNNNDDYYYNEYYDENGNLVQNYDGYDGDGTYNYYGDTYNYYGYDLDGSYSYYFNNFRYYYPSYYYDPFYY